ncbi:MAG: hypothetical protein ACAH95_12530 [Fimbriimonas sp.]
MPPYDLKVADEVFLVVADLHRLHPDAEDFSVKEILQHAEEMNLTGRIRPGFEVHVRQHCVANLPPNPGRYRTLYSSGKVRRRLTRQEDPVHELRDGKHAPDPRDVPAELRPLVEWATKQFGTSNDKDWCDQLLALRGSGKDVWKDEPADNYVQGLREDWS